MRWQNVVEIEAAPDVVWQLTVDIENLPSVTPTMLQVDRLDGDANTRGPVQVGSTARIKQPGQSTAVWTVTKLEPGREFVWQTRRMGLTLVGSHRLSGAGNRTRNELTLDVTGPGARLFGLVFGGMLRTALETENAGFKARAESGAKS